MCHVSDTAAPPLVSRSRIFQFEPLVDKDMALLLQHVLTDPDRGYGARQVQLDDDAQAHLVRVARADARAVLNALELAVESTLSDENGVIHVTLSVAEDSIQQRALRYDKTGDKHYDTVSAFIKSVRGSDPDAALYWMAKMVAAGEDPRRASGDLLDCPFDHLLHGDPVGLDLPAGVIRTVVGEREANGSHGLQRGVAGA